MIQNAEQAELDQAGLDRQIEMAKLHQISEQLNGLILQMDPGQDYAVLPSILELNSPIDDDLLRRGRAFVESQKEILMRDQSPDTTWEEFTKTEGGSKSLLDEALCQAHYGQIELPKR
jgi:hypothetical protein